MRAAKIIKNNEGCIFKTIFVNAIVVQTNEQIAK